MGIDIKYIGSQVRWPELPYTGKQSVWFPGQEEDRSDAEAALLLDTGLFSRSEQPLNGAELAKTRALVSGAVNGLISKTEFSTWRTWEPTFGLGGATVTKGVGAAASAIAGSALVSAFRSECFTFINGPVARGGAYPDYIGYSTGAYPYKTTAAPVAIEFNIVTTDATGRFEIYCKGTGTDQARVGIYDNATGALRYLTAAGGGPTFASGTGGNFYYDLVTLGAPGTYRVRLEVANNYVFYGINCKVSDALSGTPKPRKKVLIVGDSVTEPTIVDTGAIMVGHDGFPARLSLITGWDVWAAGLGSTGYVAPGTLDRVKFRDRLALDIIPQNPDGIIWAGGLNDYNGSYGAANTQAEALACFQQVKAALPNVQQVALSPFSPFGITGIPVGFWQYVDAIKAAASTAGIQFLNLLEFGYPQWAATPLWASTLTAAANSGATSFLAASRPVTGAVNDGWFVHIGSGASQFVARVSDIAGTGPYQIFLAGAALPAAYPAGTAVRIGSESFITGTGNQGAPNNTGNADVFISSDTTHPTKQGHFHIARTLGRLMATIAV